MEDRAMKVAKIILVISIVHHRNLKEKVVKFKNNQGTDKRIWNLCTAVNLSDT